MSVAAFLAGTLAVTIIQWLLSWTIAITALVNEKGLVSDLLAAMAMLVAGTVLQTTGKHIIVWHCQMPVVLIDGYTRQCTDHGKDVASIGDMLRLTLGINTVVAAVLAYFVIKGFIWITCRSIKRFNDNY